jgi:NADH dehydrogenase [ubiquinone] 1 alpha subcomplex assembly factor 5
VRAHRSRAAASLAGGDFLLREVAQRLAERLDDIRRGFPLALDLGCHTGQMAEAVRGRGGIERLIQSDLAAAMVTGAPGPRVVADEEALPFAEGRLDLVLSCCSLHWVNDLPGTLAQIRYALRPDGLLLAAMPGGSTLPELREALLRAEIETTGGAAPRVSPFVDVRDAGGLLQRAGFALPVVDVETITVTYAHLLELVRDLRAMGETSALVEGRRPLRRDTLARAAAIYEELFADRRGRLPATFQFLMLTGWKPHPGQPQAKRRGSGQIDLARALGVPDPGAQSRPGGGQMMGRVALHDGGRSSPPRSGGVA